MIEPSAVRLASAGIYAISAVVLLVLTRRKPAEVRRYCYPLVAVVAAASLGTGLWGAGIGTLSIAGGTLEGGQLLTDYIAYPFLFGFAAFVAGASRRYVGAVVAVVVVMRVGYDVAELFDGGVGLAGTATILVGYATLLGLYFGPIATAATRQSPSRALFYRKTRNLVLFMFGVLIGWAMLQIAGLFDPFTATVTLEYLDLLLRVGFAAFVVANVETLDAGVSDEDPTAGDPGVGTTGASGPASVAD